MPEPLPLCSVIVTNHNGKTLLGACLDALLSQTYPAEQIEIIVVDDASSDSSVAFVQENYPAIGVLPLKTNIGFDKACNLGAKVARGNIIVMLNNDAVPEPEWLAALVAGLQRHPEAGAAASKMLLHDQRHQLHNAGDMMGIDGIPINRGVWETDRGQYDDDIWVFGGCGGAVAYRREVWEALGGFEESFFMYLEDVDFAWRMQLRGWKTLFVPEARVYHHLSATGGGVMGSFYTGRNTIWTFARDMPGPIWHRHWRQVLTAQWHIATEALRAWRGKAARARLRGQLAGLIGLPRVLRQRQAIQADRTVPLAEIEALLVHHD